MFEICSHANLVVQYQVVSGARYANGNQITPNSLTSVSAYIQQDDLFIGSLTVKEHLTFQALVRMDKEIPYKERMKRVEIVAKEVEFIKLQILCITMEILFFVI